MVGCGQHGGADEGDGSDVGVRRCEAVNVTVVCRECGISRQTFDKYAAQCRVKGAAGLERCSTRPGRSPRAVAMDVEDTIVELRKRLETRDTDARATRRSR